MRQAKTSNGVTSGGAALIASMGNRQKTSKNETDEQIKTTDNQAAIVGSDMQTAEKAVQQKSGAVENKKPTIISGNTTTTAEKETEEVSEYETEETASDLNVVEILKAGADEEEVIDEKLPPRKYADQYFKRDPDYNWEKLKKLFYTNSLESENIRLKNFLIRNRFTWAELVTEFEANKAKNYIHVLDFNGTVFINAPTVGLAYFALKEPEYSLNYPPDVGWSFYYTDGYAPARQIGFAYKYTPTSAQLSTIRGDIGSIKYPKRETLKKQTEKKELLGFIYAEVNRELKASIKRIADSAWENQRDPSWIEVIDLQRTYCKKHNIPESRDENSRFNYVGYSIHMGAVSLIKERIVGNTLDPSSYMQDDASVAHFIELQEMFSYGIEKQVQKEYETLTAKYLKKYDKEIKAWHQPYIQIFQDKQKIVIDRLETRLDNVSDRKEIGEWTKAAEIELRQLQTKIADEASTAFETSELWQKIRAEINKELQPIQEKLMKPDLIGYVKGLNDPGLLKIVTEADKKLMDSRPVKGDKVFYNKQGAPYPTTSDKVNALRTIYWDRIRPYMESKNPKYKLDVINEVYHLFYYQYSKTFMFTDDGSPTPYLLRQWATQMLGMMESLAADLQKRPFDPMQFSGTNAYLDALVDIRLEVSYSIDYLKSIIKHPEKSEGIMADLQKGLTSLNSDEYIPFIHSIIGISKMYELNRVATRKAAGVPIAETEEALISSYATLLQIEQIQPPSTAYKVGRGAAHTIAYLGEMAILSPIGGMGTALGKGIAMKLLSKFFQGTLTKIVVKGVGVLSGAMFITVANPLRLVEVAAEMGLPLISMQFNPDGSITANVEIGENVDNPLNIFKAFASVYASNVTEMMGGRITNVIGKGIGRILPAKITGSVFSRSIMRTKEIFMKRGYHGILGEYEEEVYDHILQALLKGDLPKFTLDEQLEVFATVALVGGGMKGVQFSLATFRYISVFDMNGKKVSLSPKVLDALIALVNKDTKIAFNDQLTEWLETKQISSDEYALALLVAEKLINFDHQIVEEKQKLKDQLINNEKIDLEVEFKEYQKLYEQLLVIKLSYQNGTAEGTYHLTPSGTNLQLDINIASEAEVNAWLSQLNEAMSMIQGIAIFRGISINEEARNKIQEDLNRLYAEIAALELDLADYRNRELSSYGKPVNENMAMVTILPLPPKVINTIYQIGAKVYRILSVKGKLSYLEWKAELKLYQLGVDFENPYIQDLLNNNYQAYESMNLVELAQLAAEFNIKKENDIKEETEEETLNLLETKPFIFNEQVKAKLLRIDTSTDIADYILVGDAIVLRGLKIESKELELANEIFRLTGKRCIFPKDKLQGIEGFLEDGTPFTMKELLSTFNKFTTRINEMYDKRSTVTKTETIHWEGIEGYLKIDFDKYTSRNGEKKVDQQYVEYEFDKLLNSNQRKIQNDGTLNSITVFLMDGSSFKLDLTKLK